MNILASIDLVGVLANMNGKIQRKQSEIDHVKASIRILCDTEEQYKDALEKIKEKNEVSLYEDWLKTAKNWVNEKSGGYYGE